MAYQNYWTSIPWEEKISIEWLVPILSWTHQGWHIQAGVAWAPRAATHQLAMSSIIIWRSCIRPWTPASSKKVTSAGQCRAVHVQKLAGSLFKNAKQTNMMPFFFSFFFTCIQFNYHSPVQLSSLSLSFFLSFLPNIHIIICK